MVDCFEFIVDDAKIRQANGQIYKLVFGTALIIVAEFIHAVKTLLHDFQTNCLRQLMRIFEPPFRRLFVPLSPSSVSKNLG